MNNFHIVLRALYDHLKANVLINSVTAGDITMIDWSKTTDYALAHITLNSASLGEMVDTFDCSVILMDLVDHTKFDAGYFASDQNEGTDVLKGIDNYQYAINEMLSVSKYLVEHLRRGDLYNDLFQLDGEPSVEFFKDRFEDEVAGVVVNFNVIVPSNSTICSR